MANKKNTGQQVETNAQDNNSETTGGRGWHGNSEGHAAAGRKGGQVVAQDRAHMAQIGSKGGKAVSQNRSHMAEIGRRGGKARGKRQSPSGSEGNSNQS